MKNNYICGSCFYGGFNNYCQNTPCEDCKLCIDHFPNCACHSIEDAATCPNFRELEESE